MEDPKGLTITKSALPGAQIRSTVGLRKISVNAASGTKSFFEKATGFLFKAAAGAIGSAFSFTVSKVFTLIVSTGIYLYNFNWAISDTAIDEQIKNLWVNFGGLLGGTAGNAIGWIACGAVPAATIFAFNEAMGLYALKEVGEEALEEVVNSISVLISASVRSLSQGLLLFSYKNVRKLLRNGGKLAQAVLGTSNEKALQAWDPKQGGYWSFASAVDSFVESIPSPFIENAVENFLDEAFDACIEAGYVVADSVDSYLAMQRMSLRSQQGQHRVVELQPNRELPEKIVLSVPEQQAEQAILQTLANHTLLNNRDVGAWVGMPAEEYLKAKPMSLSLVVHFFNVDRPPWRTQERTTPLKHATYTVPNLKRSKADWETIKLACGGANGYMWGRYRCTINTSSGRQIAVYGGSESEAEDRAKALLSLSDDEALTVSVSEEKREGRRAGTSKLYKENTRMYPAYAFILHQTKVLNQNESNRSNLSGDYRLSKGRIELWTSQKPPGTDETIRESLKDGVEQAGTPDPTP